MMTRLHASLLLVWPLLAACAAPRSTRPELPAPQQVAQLTLQPAGQAAIDPETGFRYSPAERRMTARRRVDQDAKYRPVRDRQDGPPRDRVRRFGGRGDRFYAEMGIGYGDLDHDDDFYGSDEVRARLVRINVGGKTRRGLGLEGELRVLHPMDPIYEGSVDELDLDHVDFWFKFWSGIEHGDFRMPLRVGPHITGANTDLFGTGQETRYTSMGVRFEVEPELFLTDPYRSPWRTSIFGKLGGGPHFDRIDDDVADEVFHSTGTSFHAEFGTRAVFDGVSLSLSWVFQRYVVDESEPEGALVVPRIEDEFHGLMFTMGVRF